MSKSLSEYAASFFMADIWLYCAVFVLALKVVLCIAPLNFPQNVFFADITKSALESYINQARKSEGISPLSENQKLNQAAMLKAQNMMAEQYFAHISPDGVTPWHWIATAGYDYKYAGENLAIGFYESEEVYAAWLNSRAHRENLLNPNYTEMGTAVLKGFGENKAVLVVQMFGSQKPVPVSSPIIHENNNMMTELQNSSSSASSAVAKESEPKVLSSSQIIKAGIQTEAKEIDGFSNYVRTGLSEDINYGISLVMAGILLSIILFGFQIKDESFRSRLVRRSVVILILLAVASAINKEAVLYIIPHRINI